jgi:hypothetical protein
MRIFMGELKEFFNAGGLDEKLNDLKWAIHVQVHDTLNLIYVCVPVHMCICVYVQIKEFFNAGDLDEKLNSSSEPYMCISA